jgi:hypothetical protein
VYVFVALQQGVYSLMQYNHKEGGRAGREAGTQAGQGIFFISLSGAELGTVNFV